MKREEEHKIIRYDKEKVLGNVWWDGKQIQSDSDQVLGMLKGQIVNNTSFEDGKEFLKHLPSLFKSGYVIAKKVK